MGRPKTGRKKFSHSLSLTLAQIEFLDKQPDANKLVGRILDDLIALQGEIEPYLSVVLLKYKIDILNRQLDKMDREYALYLRDHEEEMYEKGDRYGTPLGTPQARIHFKVAEGYKKAIKGIEAKIEELEKQMKS